MVKLQLHKVMISNLIDVKSSQYFQILSIIQKVEDN